MNAQIPLQIPGRLATQINACDACHNVIRHRNECNVLLDMCTVPTGLRQEPSGVANSATRDSQWPQVLNELSRHPMRYADH
jgi:hypothetical protein